MAFLKFDPKLDSDFFSEWTEFTDAMNEELVKSHQMLEADDESGNLARDIGNLKNIFLKY
mgnify:CR=1 FL=1